MGSAQCILSLQIVLNKKCSISPAGNTARVERSVLCRDVGPELKFQAPALAPAI